MRKYGVESQLVVWLAEGIGNIGLLSMVIFFEYTYLIVIFVALTEID